MINFFCYITRERFDVVNLYNVRRVIKKETK